MRKDSENHPSLEGMHSTVAVPPASAGFWRNWRAFVGPALLVSVGYMDPGNWGTDLQGGAQYKYDLMWVVLLASIMAIFLQVMSARLGLVTGKDLAQCCRDFYPKWSRWPNWFLCEIAIAACDLAEVLGSAIAINLLFGIPLLWAVIITAADVFILLSLQRFGMRTIEAVVLVLVATIGVYATTRQIFDVGVMYAFGVLGYVMRRAGFSPLPMLIAFLLGPLLEDGVRRAMIMSGGSPMIFVERPISLLFVAMAVLTLAAMIWRAVQNRRKAARGEARDEELSFDEG